jgi:small subunit ribosomal protein S27e
MVPKPRSNFLSVQCTECREKTILFTHTTTDIYCKSCGQLIAKKTGGKARILGKVLNILD